MSKYSYTDKTHYKFSVVDCLTYIPNNMLLLTVYSEYMANGWIDVINDIDNNALDYKHIALEYVGELPESDKDFTELLEKVSHITMRLTNVSATEKKTLKGLSKKIEIL